MSQPQVAPAVRRVEATTGAIALIERLRAKFGPLMFHQTHTGREDAGPMCYPEDEFFLSHCDVCIGAIGGVPYYVSAPRFESCRDLHLTVDVGPGHGGPFSLESGLGVRFVLRSRPFTDAERSALQPVKRGCPDGGPAENAAGES